MRVYPLLLVLALPAGPASADQPDAAMRFDDTIPMTCLENAEIARQDGAEMDDADCIGVASGICMEQPGGDSTAGMINCTSDEIDFWDGLLNDSYQKLMSGATGWRPSGDPRVTEDMAPELLLRQMQRDWIAYRDSSCDWAARPWEGGSIVGVIRAGCLLDTTAEQAIRLRRMLHAEEGMR